MATVSIHTHTPVCTHTPHCPLSLWVWRTWVSSSHSTPHIPAPEQQSIHTLYNQSTIIMEIFVLKIYVCIIFMLNSFIVYENLTRFQLLTHALWWVRKDCWSKITCELWYKQTRYMCTCVGIATGVLIMQTGRNYTWQWEMLWKQNGHPIQCIMCLYMYMYM